MHDRLSLQWKHAGSYIYVFSPVHHPSPFSCSKLAALCRVAHCVLLAIFISLIYKSCPPWFNIHFSFIQLIFFNYNCWFKINYLLYTLQLSWARPFGPFQFTINSETMNLCIFRRIFFGWHLVNHMASAYTDVHMSIPQIRFKHTFSVDWSV